MLNCVANWTPRWFNKPKFHIILHLVDHIYRFGPPLLFATETFESFNGVIRSFSVHSNRQAPSRDIAIAFANANRIRHLTSGAKFYAVHPVDEVPSFQQKRCIPTRSDYQVVGEEVTKLIEREDHLFKEHFGGPNIQQGVYQNDFQG